MRNRVIATAWKVAVRVAIAAGALLGLALVLIALRLATLPRSNVVVRNREKVAVEACTLLVETEFWWDQARYVGPMPPGSAVSLRFHPLDESDFVINCRFADGQTRSGSTTNFWDPAPGDSTLVLELGEDGLLVHNAQGGPPYLQSWSDRPVHSTWAR